MLTYEIEFILLIYYMLLNTKLVENDGTATWNIYNICTNSQLYKFIGSIVGLGQVES